MNKEILECVDKIVAYIKNTSSYQGYLKTRELLDKDMELKKIIADVKRYQQMLVKKKDTEIEKKLDSLIEQLNNSPLYLEYNNYLEEINNMLIIFENKINKYFNDVFN